MQIITADFETYYDNVYSLSRMTTEEYIRDKRFEIIGVGVKVDDGKTRFRTGTHRGLQDWLKGEYDWDNCLQIAHNNLFDAAILSWVLDIHPKGLGDTLSMARALLGAGAGLSLAKLAEHYKVGTKGNEVFLARGMRRKMFSLAQMQAYGGYCRNDTNLCYDLFKIMLPHFPLNELKVISQTLKMFTEPVLELDKQLLTEHLLEVRMRKVQLLQDANVELSDLTSNEKFAGLLRELDVKIPMKISTRTGNEAYAFAKTDEGFKELLEHDDERVQALAAARVGNKTTIEESRTERFIAIADRGPIPVPLKCYGAHTTRWSGTEKINLQNLSSREKDKSKLKLKRSIRAPKDFFVVNADSASIEARILAWDAQQLDLLDDFINGRDAYVGMAAKIYNKMVEEILNPSRERDIGKATVLGAGYGMGAERFNAELKKSGIYMTVEETAAIIDLYRKANPRIVDYWVQCKSAIVAMSKGQTRKIGQGAVVVVEGGILLPSGMIIRYPNIRQTVDKKGQRQYVFDAGHGKVKKIYGGAMTENICQGLASCVIREQGLLVAKRYRWVLTVHDSIVALVPKAEIEEGVAYITECLRHVPKWATGLPLDCKVGYGETYGDC